jgi:ATP-dependent DNA helicase RecG
MTPEDKDATMQAFAAGQIDVLVSTTVIEVGVDVHNASMMVILDADRFGVSQLHQLRGRVGRGGLPGLCLLVSGTPNDETGRRLESVAATTDGFELARLDLSQRREGDILGAAQHGRRSQLEFLHVLEHEAVIEQAREDAFALVADDPDLTTHPQLAAAVEARIDAEQAAYLERG